mgnify:CR=1 FL=1
MGRSVLIQAGLVNLNPPGPHCWSLKVLKFFGGRTDWVTLRFQKYLISRLLALRALTRHCVEWYLVHSFCKLDWRSQSSLCHPDCPQNDLKALVDTLAAPLSASRWEDGATAERGAIPRIAGRSPPLVWWSPIAVNHHSQESSPSRSQFQKFLSDIRHQVCISSRSRCSTNPMHSSIHHYHHRSLGHNDPTIPWGKS